MVCIVDIFDGDVVVMYLYIGDWGLIVVEDNFVDWV